MTAGLIPTSRYLSHQPVFSGLRVYALGDVSGAHFNPAVTVAILASGRCPELTPQKAGAFAGVQVAGGVAAAFTPLGAGGADGGRRGRGSLRKTRDGGMTVKTRLKHQVQACKVSRSLQVSARGTIPMHDLCVCVQFEQDTCG